MTLLDVRMIWTLVKDSVRPTLYGTYVIEGQLRRSCTLKAATGNLAQCGYIIVNETTRGKTFWLHRQPEKKTGNTTTRKFKKKSIYPERNPLPRTTEVMVSSGRILRNEFSFTPLEEKCTALEEKEMNVLEEQQPQFETVGPFWLLSPLWSHAYPGSPSGQGTNRPLWTLTHCAQQPDSKPPLPC